MGGSAGCLVRDVAGASDDSLCCGERSVRCDLSSVKASQFRAESNDGGVTGIVPRQAVVVVDLTLYVVDLALQAIDLALSIRDGRLCGT